MEAAVRLYPSEDGGFRGARQALGPGCERDLKAGVGVAPNEWNTREPVFCFDRLAGASKLFRWQDADGCGEFGASDFSADGAGGDLDLRVVADALALSQFTIRHEVEFAAVFRKPDGRVHGDAILAEGGEADVTLAANFGRDGRGADAYIVRRRGGFLRDGLLLWPAAAVHLPARFFAGLLRIASGDLLVPGGVESPGPRFAYGAANHRLEGAGLADGAQVDVDEDSTEHDERKNVVNDIADGDGRPSEGPSARPKDDASDQEGDAAADDLPELNLLTGVEEPGVGWVHF